MNGHRFPENVINSFQLSKEKSFNQYATSGKYYIAAFIDILNQSKKLDHLKEFPIDSDYWGSWLFDRFVTETIGVAKRIAFLRDQYLENYKNSKPNLKILNEEENEVFQKYKMNQISIQNFSDGFVIYAPIHEDMDSLPVRDVWGIIGFCCSIMQVIIAEDVAIRGGIDIGIGFDMPDLGLYGPIISSSYQLESKIAKNPRLVVGNNLLNYIRFKNTDSGYDMYRERSSLEKRILVDSQREIANLLQSFISKDDDGQWIIHYLGDGFYENIEIVEFPFSIILRSYNFIMKELTRHYKNENEKLINKYTYLLDYYEKNISTWY